MDIEQRTEGSVTIVSPHQKLDTGTAPAAAQTFSSLLDQGAQRIVVDFSDVPYISSAGLRVLLSTAKQLRAKGGELRVCALNDAVQEVFEISGFNTLLPVFVSTADAVREF
jgi:anti-sigma B factor antagonist